LSSEMIVWAAVFLLGGLFGGAKATPARHVAVLDNHWRELAEARVQARNAS
jgi:hypothetical protein